jgi:autotransporter-associated beta strand protein
MNLESFSMYRLRINLLLLSLGFWIGGSASIFAGTAAYQTQVLADTPLLFYRLNDAGATAADQSGNSHSGTYIATPTLGVPGLGTPTDNGVTFNGTTQYVSAPASANPFGATLGTSSYEFVFNTTNTTAKGALFGTFNTGSTTAAVVALNENAAGSGAVAANSVRLFLRDDGNNFLGAAFENAAMSDGNFHHLLYTYDAAGATSADKVKVYFDGVEQALTFAPGGNGSPSTFTNFGFTPDFAARNVRGTHGQFFNGTLDEAAIYSTVLTVDDAIARAQALGITIATPNQWDVNGGGSFNVAVNWSDGVVPTGQAIFGSALTSANAPATVTLDSPASVTGVKFQNSNQYILAGPSALTLTGSATVAVSGTHQIIADIAGTVGLNKTETGTLVLAAAKSYTGTTSVQAGTLLLNNLDAIDNQASGVLNTSATGTVLLSTGATGTLAAQLTGNGIITTDDALEPADTITIARSNSTFSGLIRIDDGTLAVSHNDALGSGGTVASRTTLDDDSTAKIALTGGVTIANEILDMDGRSTAAVGLTSSGNNSWNGSIDGQSTGSLPFFNIESTSANLTLNRLYAADVVAAQTFVFSGSGDITIAGGLSEDALDDAAGNIVPSVNDNVGLIKRGSGNLTVATGTDGGRIDYWFGPTVIEQGTLTVTDPLVNNQGELRSLDIAIRNGAALNTSAFTTYSQQVGQVFRGDGTIVAGTLALFDDGSLAPGDSVGAVGSLAVTGNVSLGAFATPGTEGNWSFDVGNTTNTAGDILAVSGTFTSSGSPALSVNVTPAHGHLDAGSRTIISHTGGANAAMNGIATQITAADGTPLNTRQTVAVNGNTAGQVNVVVTGEEAARTWQGNVAGAAWDVAVTNNWQQGDFQYRDLDRVTFNDSATGSTTVAVDGPRHAGSVLFSNTTKSYKLTGAGGIVGTGDVNVTGTGLVDLANTGNNYSGATTIAAGGKLQMTTATTGNITNSGTLSLRTSVTTNALVQNGVQTIGTGAFKVFAVEAENFQAQTANGPANSTNWGTITAAPNDSLGAPAENPADPSLSGQALIASPLSENNTTTAATTQNFVTYSMKFTEPGTYYWYGRLRAVDGGATVATGNVPDSLSNNDDSLLLPATDMGNGNADPQTLSTNIDFVQAAALRAVNAEGTGSTTSFFGYDWYRSGEGALGGDAGFEKIVVTANDVANGSVFQFKAAARETGLAMDKHVFVRSPDFTTDPNFGTITDADLSAVTAVNSTSPASFFSPGTVLNVNGNLTMSGNGSNLNLLLGNADAHDQINITGNLAADGTLRFEAGNGGFGAVAGAIFDVFNFTSASGAFDSIILPSLGAGLLWDTSNLLVTGDLAVVASPTTPGDFDQDGDVDGRDFLVWQRNPGIGNLADWQNNYGSNGGPLSASTAVPEPSTIVSVALLMCVAFTKRGHTKS